MNVLIHTSYPALNEWLEIAQAHLAAGDRVTLLQCQAELLTCNWNPGHEGDRCVKCRATRVAAVQCLNGSVEEVSYLEFLTDTDRQQVRGLPYGFASQAELRRFAVGEFDVGMAVVSELIDRFKDPEIDPVTHLRLVRDLLVPAVGQFLSLQNYLAAHKPDRAYIFNGRYPHTRAALRACQSRGVPVTTHENGHDKSHYMLYPDDIPHSRTIHERLIDEQWEGAAGNPAERERVARAWFDGRSAGREVHDKDNDKSFVATQRAGLLPDGFDPAAHNIAVYNTSEDEWAAIGDEWTPLIYPTQAEGLRRIAADLPKAAPHSRLYLRVHPHLAGRPAADALRELASPQLTVIPADSPVSTYTLLRYCSTVLTFGSTVGIEAVYAGKPSVLANLSLYRHLGATYNVSAHDELMALLERSLAPKPVEGALKYGYYMATFGQPFRYYRKDDRPFAEGTMNGRVYRPGRPLELLLAATRRVPGIGPALDRYNRRRTLRLLTGGTS